MVINDDSLEVVGLAGTVMFIFAVNTMIIYRTIVFYRTPIDLSNVFYEVLQ